jgi:hypothetical protein
VIGRREGMENGRESEREKREELQQMIIFPYLVLSNSFIFIAALLVVPGEGSTFAAGVYQSWLSAYAFVDNQVEFTYNPTGSGAGISGITAGKDVWAGSDAALTFAQTTAGTYSFLLSSPPSMR